MQITKLRRETGLLSKLGNTWFGSTLHFLSVSLLLPLIFLWAWFFRTYLIPAANFSISQSIPQSSQHIPARPLPSVLGIFLLLPSIF